MREGRALSAGAVAAVLSLLLAGCAGTGGPNGSRSLSPRTRSTPRAAVAAGAGAIPPEVFPTIAGTDFSLFPRDHPSPYAPGQGGRTIHVAHGARGGDGSQEKPFASPVSAVRRAHPGDVVLIGDGEYPISDDRCACGLTMRTDGVTLAAEHPGKAILVPAGKETSGLDLRADHVVVDGFLIRGFGDTAVYVGPDGDTQRDVVLKRLAIEAGSNGILTGITESGKPGPRPVVDGLLVSETQILGGSETLIGINCAQGPCVNVRISGVTVRLTAPGEGDSGADAIGFESGDNVIVEGSEVTGASADGVDLKASRAVVVNTRVHDIGRNGVKLWRGGDVINTIVYNTDADAAVVFELPSRYRILHSVIARHSIDTDAYAATISSDDRGKGKVEVIDSIFFDNSGALWVSGEYDLSVRNSIFSKTRNGQFVVWARPQEITVEHGQGFRALEKAGGSNANREVDPGFVNPAGGDFALVGGSAARDRGTSDVDAYPTFDYEGRPRIQGRAPDLGPYETPPP